MSLDWNVDKIENYEELCWRPALDDQGNPAFGSDGEPLVQIEPITDCLIWSTMLVEIGKITEKNYEEFYRRLVEAEEVGIATEINYFCDTEEKWNTRIPTLAEVRAHIGLSTNVYSGRSKNPGIRAFNKRIKRRKKDIKRREEQIVYPEDTTEEDMLPEKLDSMELRKGA